MKGIILAGGTGTRGFPLSITMSKQMMPTYNKPMIYYPLGVLMLAGIRDIVIISTPRDLPRLKSLLGDGSAYGISLSYAMQPQSKGPADAFLVARRFIENQHVALIQGDNIFYGAGLAGLCQQAACLEKGATLFACRADNHKRYGVVEFDHLSGRPNKIQVEAGDTHSGWAVTGFYFYDNEVVDIAASLAVSKKSDLNIAAVNRSYLDRGLLNICKLGRGFAWLDTGTHESLHDASSFVRTVEARQSSRIMCPEEIAFELGYLTVDEVLSRAYQLGDNNYSAYLRRRVDEYSYA